MLRTPFLPQARTCSRVSKDASRNLKWETCRLPFSLAQPGTREFAIHRPCEFSDALKKNSTGSANMASR